MDAGRRLGDGNSGQWTVKGHVIVNTTCHPEPVEGPNAATIDSASAECRRGAFASFQKAQDAGARGRCIEARVILYKLEKSVH